MAALSLFSYRQKLINKSGNNNEILQRRRGSDESVRLRPVYLTEGATAQSQRRAKRIRLCCLDERQNRAEQRLVDRSRFSVKTSWKPPPPLRGDVDVV
ncbi:uncharacterized protein V6R79_021149 [Siganus canaliculatus]